MNPMANWKHCFLLLYICKDSSVLFFRGLLFLFFLCAFFSPLNSQKKQGLKVNTWKDLIGFHGWGWNIPFLYLIADVRNILRNIFLTNPVTQTIGHSEEVKKWLKNNQFTNLWSLSTINWYNWYTSVCSGF